MARSDVPAGQTQTKFGTKTKRIEKGGNMNGNSIHNYGIGFKLQTVAHHASPLKNPSSRTEDAAGMGRMAPQLQDVIDRQPYVIFDIHYVYLVGLFNL